MISSAKHANGSRTPAQPLTNQPGKPEDPLRTPPPAAAAGPAALASDRAARGQNLNWKINITEIKATLEGENSMKFKLLLSTRPMIFQLRGSVARHSVASRHESRTGPASQCHASGRTLALPGPRQRAGLRVPAESRAAAATRARPAAEGPGYKSRPGPHRD